MWGHELLQTGCAAASLLSSSWVQLLHGTDASTGAGTGGVTQQAASWRSFMWLRRNDNLSLEEKPHGAASLTPVAQKLPGQVTVCVRACACVRVRSLDVRTPTGERAWLLIARRCVPTFTLTSAVHTPAWEWGSNTVGHTTVIDSWEFCDCGAVYVLVWKCKLRMTWITQWPGRKHVTANNSKSSQCVQVLERMLCTTRSTFGTRINTQT